MGGALGCLAVAIDGQEREGKRLNFFFKKRNRLKLERGEIDCFFFLNIILLCS